MLAELRVFVKEEAAYPPSPPPEFRLWASLRRQRCLTTLKINNTLTFGALACAAAFEGLSSVSLVGWQLSAISELLICPRYLAYKTFT